MPAIDDQLFFPRLLWPLACVKIVHPSISYRIGRLVQATKIRAPHFAQLGQRLGVARFFYFILSRLVVCHFAEFYDCTPSAHITNRWPSSWVPRTRIKKKKDQKR